ncbi:MAG TPA: WD40 repeat domain-containing protein, partial [Planctomycetota bacterium]|nr:WD40 repeat domain-containing protein [Planctomycetota bacterium]
HPGGKILATGGSMITLHDTETGKRLDTRESHEEWIQCLRYTPDGKRLISSSRDGTVRTWESPTGRPIRRLEAATDWGAAAAVSRDGKRIVTCGRDDKMRLWDLESGRMDREFAFQAYRRCGGLSFTADEQRLIFAGVDLMWIDVAAGKAVKSSRVMTDHGTVNNAMGFALSADGKVIATGHFDKTVRLWNAETLEVTRVITGHKGGQGVGGFSLAFTPDGRLLAAADENEHVIRLWEVESGRQVALFEGHGNEVTSISISPDGLWLASGGLDGTARLWELSTAKEMIRFLDDKIWKWVGSVALSPDGRQMATGLNGTILTWTLRPPGPKVERPMDDLWKDLSSPEADRAFRAMWGFVDGGEKSIKALADRIPLKVDAPDRIKKLIAALGSEDIDAREEATRQLAASAGSAETIIIEALKGDIGAEAKARLERILSLLDLPLPQSTELLHRLRALQALERLGAVEAIKSIEKQGPFQRLRREAGAALRRLGAR